MSRIQLGADFRSDRARNGGGAHAALIAATLFQRPNGGILMPREHGFQIAAADIDKDGKEDETAIRFLPLTADAGVALAANGTGELTLEPTRWCKILSITVAPSLYEVLFTSMAVADVPLFPSRGSIPAANFAHDSLSKEFDIPWIGPGVALTIGLKNPTGDALVFRGSGRVIAQIGNTK